MTLNVLHLVLYAHPKVNGSTFCVHNHMDCMYGYVRQDVEVNQEVADIVDKYGIHEFHSVDVDKMNVDDIGYIHDMWTDNAIVVDAIKEARDSCAELSKFLLTMHDTLPDVDNCARIVSVLLSDFELGWYDSIRNQQHNKEISDEEAAFSVYKICSRGMLTMRVDITTMRTDDCDGNMLYNIISNPNHPDVKFTMERKGSNANEVYERLITRTGAVDYAYSIYPISTGIIHSSDMWESFLCNRVYYSDGLAMEDSSEDGSAVRNMGYVAELQWVATIPHDIYDWDFWRQKAWDNKFEERNTYFRFLYRVMMITETWMTPFDKKSGVYYSDYPTIISDDEDNGKDVIDGYMPNCGRTLSLMSSNWFNYIYEKHCEYYEIEYDDFWDNSSGIAD